MTPAEPQQEKWLAILREINLDSLFSQPPQRAFLFQRLDQFTEAYARHVRGVEVGVLPATASCTDILAEYERNPHRVGTLLEAVAFQCSPDILVMVWMTVLGARIESLGYEYKRGQTSAIKATLVLPDGLTEKQFRSSEIWDVAVFRLATLSKADDQPIIEDFYPLWIPPQQPWNQDFYVATPQGNFSAVDVAPTASTLPRWEIHQVYSKQAPRLVGSIDIHVGNPVFFPTVAERDDAILQRAWQALSRKYGEDVLTRGRPGGV